MKKFLNHRVLPFVCVFSILISLCVIPASADFDMAYADDDSVVEWTARFHNPVGVVDAIILDAYCELKGLPTDTDPVDVTWSMFNAAVSTYGEVGLGQLNQIVSTYNGYFNLPPSESGYSFREYFDNLTRNTVAGLLGLPNMHFEVQMHDKTGMLRIKETTYGIWVVNSSGMYPYVDPAQDDEKSDKWIGDVTAADRATKEVAVQTLDRLNLMCLQLRERGIPAQIKSLSSNYKCIWWNRQVYADYTGVPYLAWVEEDKSAVNQDRKDDVIIENGNVIEGDLVDNSTNIDLENMLITLPDGSINIIDKIIYDESTKSYHIDSHDTYNYTVNNYYTWNYYINYTSITYIGQTEEYNKYYEVYYELPDGRSSSDLTKEDLEQLNLSVDVIPYGRSADDTSLRSLYHFDGDTKDSSYWNYCTRFDWRMGASLTYMDAGVFGGALYLDEKLHEFRCYLPSNIGVSDFTLQFRYYQSATLTPVTDSYIYVGGRVICHMNGSHFVGINGETLAEIPVGTWNEIAVMRENGRVRVYLNGLMIYGVTINDALSDLIELHFGSEQQTYKYIDELRVLNYSLQTDGLPYECTSVPYDTNLTLVLPDSAVPVADEYWSFDQTITPAWSKDFSTGYSDAFSADIGMTPQNYFEGHLGRVQYISSATSVTEYEGFTSVVSHSTPILPPSGAGTGLIIPISGYRTTPEYFDFTGFKSRYQTGGNSGTHTFSLVTRDGETYSLTFDMFYPIYMENRVRASASFDWGSIYYIEYSNVLTYILVVPNKGVPLDFVYMEIVKGSTPNTGHEFVQSVTGIDKADLNTPTLAVRTDIDITSYHIGGVRPSLPKKGMVWAMVENERIASLQIYNGQAWEGVDGRIWTGERWIPMSSYNIITLQDMYDIVDATPNYEYIYSESGFWAWWQKSWNAFTEKLFLALGSGGSGGSGASGGAGSSELNKVDLDSAPVVSDPDEEDGKSLWQFIILVVDGGKSVVTGTRELFSGVVSTIPDTMDGITGAFDSGGIAVGIFDGSDPDAEDIESEVLDPWRYQ